MGYIKNYSDLAINNKREIVLDLIEEGLLAIKPDNIIDKNFKVNENILTVHHKKINLNDFEKIYILAFGKGSAKIAKLMEERLGIFLDGGYVIDTISQSFEKLEFCLGTHPLPSKINIDFSKKALSKLSDLNKKTLVLTVICGGGSVLFDIPNVEIEKLINVNNTLLHSQATIPEINIIRKHLSKTKGGGLVKLLNPARVVSLIFSDVVGDGISTIASGPTVFDNTSIYEAIEIYHKYKLAESGITKENFTETPKNEKLFINTDNILALSNNIALEAMQKKAQQLKITSFIYSNKFESEAELAGKALIDITKPHSILLAGGETTHRVTNPNGKGGRNQTVVLSGLYSLDNKTVIASINTDGYDNSPVAGAIGDSETLEKAKKLGINPQEYLNEDNSFIFFKNVQDAIITDGLSTNISDLIVVYKE